MNEHTEWFAIRVKSRSEKLAAAHLRAKGVEVFPATAAFRRVWIDRIRVVEMPLFPGYIFARFDPVNARLVEDAAGVTSIVKCGNQYCRVDAREIDDLRKLVGSGTGVHRTPYLVKGARVRVKYGPFAGAEGTLTNVRDQYRLVIAISILQRSIAVDIDEAMVELVGSEALRCSAA